MAEQGEITLGGRFASTTDMGTQTDLSYDDKCLWQACQVCC